MDKGSPYSLSAKIKNLIRLFGTEFYKIFQNNLCDNGSELEIFYKLENDEKIIVFTAQIHIIAMK